MKYFYDPQVHSDYSDGDYPPAQVVEKAVKNGLKGVILTDHNTISGWEKFKEVCQKANVDTFRGVEISTKFGKMDIHILGYGKFFDESVLEKGLRGTKEGYDERSKEMIEKLRKRGFTNIDFEDVKKNKKEGGIVMKYDILKAICKEKGEDLEGVGQFKKLLKRDGPGYVPYGDWAMSPFEAVELIKKAGGVSVISHPGDTTLRSDNSSQEVLEKVIGLIKKLQETGLRGIEVRYITHTEEQEKVFTYLAKDLDMITTGGSDWHGEYHHPEIIMGEIGSTEEEFRALKNILP